MSKHFTTVSAFNNNSSLPSLTGDNPVEVLSDKPINY